MPGTGYDVIVVGARCAGSPTAMLLARAGHRVLLLDRARFPSDTLSTHLVHPPGVGALRRWGLLDRLIATGCPPIHTYAFDFDGPVIAGSPGPADNPVAYGPRRIVLDKLLVDAAAESGAEVREGFVVSEVIFDENGRVTGIRGREQNGPLVTERARVVVGADGLHSTVARAVEARHYNEKPRLMVGYYSYFSGLDLAGVFRAHSRPYRAFGAWPTHDGLTLVGGCWPYAEFAAVKRDIEGSYLSNFALAPAFAERIAAARRESRLVGAALPNYFRTPYGPGWALVGDAGYCKDFFTAQGISDAFLAAQWCAHALDEALSGRRSYTEAMDEYQEVRDAHARPIYDFTIGFAALEPPSPEFAALLSDIDGNSQAMDAFAQVNSGVLSLADFMAEWG
ncbi:NAD(P)/FAD-dependent oxidoreductase [Micromonospora craniellae]|uniref:NAD(P)/FAD-dependent oxidoreductase n=1 Tax=Micromonospora craniellae TaxID=2294034 RepID=A0A372G4I5_9ACTN|nr:NAD(P)/FAD-dependent oxidoreductase [Micromonospora craniellae]QOC90671.1 NAD(P)/FAD-dependent oxidoreductase [Micromonospora craniellae]RFS47951.1 NAD(P)/FAD-dependent oxidoreductase [Micromonospora craniellae]